MKKDYNFQVFHTRVIKKMFIAERHGHSAVSEDVQKCEASYDYMISDNIQRVLCSFCAYVT